MYAAHLAAGVAIHSRAPKAPPAAILAGAFVPDFLWIVFAVAGLEPAGPGRFFDDWSHSLVMTLVWASLFALFFVNRGRAVATAAWIAVLSHFLLDMPIHPKDLALYPHSAIHLGWGLWKIGRTSYWWAQLGVVAVLLAFYAVSARRSGLATRRIAWTCGYVVAFHAMAFPAG